MKFLDEFLEKVYDTVVLAMIGAWCTGLLFVFVYVPIHFIVKFW